MTESLRGVNLGGWLVLEKWMTPSVFTATEAEDEYDFMQTPGASATVTNHRKTFITEADFIWLADHGINAVRIPVGYWLIDGDAPYAAGAKYLDWAFLMAEKYRIAVLLDIHGLPGSQNGNDHSGRIGRALWQKEPDFQRRSLAYVKKFAERYANEPALWGIEVINEPNPGILQISLRRYYRRAYRLLDGLLPSHVKIIYSDAWSPRIFAWTLFAKRRAVMDVHLYHMATLGAKSHPLDWYYRKLTRRLRTLRFLSRLHPIIIGEWSGVISGETLAGVPAAEASRLEREHFLFQQNHYTAFTGAFMWNYKTESHGASFWDYRSLVDSHTVKGYNRS